MGLVSEEKKMMTIRSIYSAPISSFKVVVSKFLSIFSFYLLLLSFTTFYFIYLRVYSNADLSIVVSSYLGTVLLCFSSISIGLYFSTRFKNQFVSFLGSTVFLLIFMVLHWTSAKLNLSQSSIKLLSYLSTNTHLDPFYRGLIRSSDICYFVLLGSYFLYLSINNMEKRNWK